jgi:predicted transcriptional regulator
MNLSGLLSADGGNGFFTAAPAFQPKKNIGQVLMRTSARVEIRSPLSGPASLGPLEGDIMQVLWTAGDCCVEQVRQRLPRPIVYTTVMTTLVRLFRKGLLDRRAAERRFIYSPRVSAEEWGKMAAADSVAQYFATPNLSRKLLLSYLVEALLQEDIELLAEAEEQIRRGRRGSDRPDLSGVETSRGPQAVHHTGKSSDP